MTVRVDTQADQRIPEIVRCWEKANAAMPPSDPLDPNDPSVSLDTLAAIAHAKWRKAERLVGLLADAEKARDELAEALRFVMKEWDISRFALTDEQNAALAAFDAAGGKGE